MAEDFPAGGIHHVTFIVRLARDAAGQVTGVVERVRTGEKTRVAAVKDVADVLGQWLADDEARPDPARHGDVR